LKQNILTVYEGEEVLIECSVKRNNNNDGPTYWEGIDENGVSCTLKITEDKEDKYDLKKDNSSLTILNTTMSDSGNYRCYIDYSASKRHETAISETAKLIIEKSRHIL
jgi:hypothetical protein